MSVIDDKQHLRRTALAARRRIPTDAAAAAAEAIGRLFLDTVVVDPGAPVAAYWPMAEEADPRPLLRALHDRRHPCLLPVVTAPRSPLAFRRWRPGDSLEAGPFGTRHPSPAAGEAVPRVVLAPLLAFDAEGYRLGYGGGYYDATLAALRHAGPVLALGIAFAAQRLDRVPRLCHDQRLDGVVTEDAVIGDWTTKP